MKKTLFVIGSLGLLAACGHNTGKTNDIQNIYSDAGMWCSLPDSTNAEADVFYIVSTNVMQSKNEDGTPSKLAVLNVPEKQVLAEEINYVHENIFPEKFNFYAPYYHQLTMETIADSTVTADELTALKDSTMHEIYDAFDYYMENYNQGRPFILAGFSQGAIDIMNILMSMTPEQKERMVAAYEIGYGLDSLTLGNPNVKAAGSAYDTGVVVSFNTVKNVESIYNVVWNNAVACINPANWHTDSEPASFEFEGDKVTVSVDQTKHILLMEGLDPTTKGDFGMTPWSEGCYHHFDILLYSQFLRQNALDRLANFK